MRKAIYSDDHKFTVERLKKARLDAGLDQSAAAKLLRTTQSQISKVECGQRRIDIVQLKNYARAYRKPIDYFLRKS